MENDDFKMPDISAPVPGRVIPFPAHGKVVQTPPTKVYLTSTQKIGIGLLTDEIHRAEQARTEFLRLAASELGLDLSQDTHFKGDHFEVTHGVS